MTNLHYENSVLKKLEEQKCFNLNHYHKQLEQPKRVNIKLYNHQKTILYYLNKLEKYEDIINTGFSRVGIICSPPGSGKSLIALSQICNKPKLNDILKENPNILFQHKFKKKLENFNGYGRDYSNCKNIDTNLIIVPHLLIHQWKNYIEKYTDLSYYIINKQKNILDNPEEYSKYDVVLIKSTFYNNFLKSLNENSKIEMNNPKYFEFIRKYNLFESLESIQKYQSTIYNISKYELCNTLLRCNMLSIKKRYDKIYNLNNDLYNSTKNLKNEMENIKIDNLVNEYFNNIREVNKINSFGGYYFNRVFYDELDSVIIPNNARLNSLFIYAISGNYHNLLYPNGIKLNNYNMEIKGIHSSGYLKSFFNEIFENCNIKNISSLFLSIDKDYLNKSISNEMKNKNSYIINCKTTRETILLDGLINKNLMDLIHSNDYNKLYDKLQVVENVNKESLVDIYSKSLKNDIKEIENKNNIYTKEIIPKIQKLFNIFVLDKFEIFIEKYYDKKIINDYLLFISKCNNTNEIYSNISNIYKIYLDKKNKSKKKYIYDELKNIINIFNNKLKDEEFINENINDIDNNNKIRINFTNYLNNLINVVLQIISENKKNINELNNKYNSLNKRLLEIEYCNICFNDDKKNLSNLVNLNCCMNYICLDCFVRNYQISKKCPYCRTLINSTDDINFLLAEHNNLNEEEKININVPNINSLNNLHNYLKEYSIFFNKENIVDLLIDNIKKINTNYHILIFSENNNFIQNLNNKNEIMKVSKNIQNIEKLITNYNENNSILFLDSKYFNFGLNLEKTTHLILTHKLNHITERQVISRAYRIGRNTDLDIYHLYHKNE